MLGEFAADSEKLPRIVNENCAPDHDFAAHEHNSMQNVHGC